MVCSVCWAERVAWKSNESSVISFSSTFGSRYNHFKFQARGLVWNCGWIKKAPLLLKIILMFELMNMMITRKEPLGRIIGARHQWRQNLGNLSKVWFQIINQDSPVKCRWRNQWSLAKYKLGLTTQPCWRQTSFYVSTCWWYAHCSQYAHNMVTMMMKITYYADE